MRSIMMAMMLYQRWKPRARLSLMKNVWLNTKPCCSSPKKMGPSRPGHTWDTRTALQDTALCARQHSNPPAHSSFCAN